MFRIHALPLALALLSGTARAADRFAATLFTEVNAYRDSQRVGLLDHNAALSEAADIEATWTNLALRRGYRLAFHTTDTAWLLAERPDLRWERLYATYGPVLPAELGIHDVARLCGYSGLCRDNIGLANKTPANAVTGWARSTSGHRENMLDPAWTELGTGHKGGGQDAVCVAVFGDAL